LVFTVKLDCAPDSMRVSLNTIHPFDGKIYAKEDPLSCETKGRSETTTSLVLPLQKSPKCGVKEEVHK